MARKKANNPERIVTVFIIITLAVALLSLLYVSKSIFFPKAQTAETHEQQAALSLTPFDVELAKRLMDKDSDGKCDSCGMDVEFCIQSGQLQCSMDSKSTIGVLDTTKKTHHYHADFKVFIHGRELDFNQPKYFVRSRFIHVENDPQGDSGKVLHMHATGVPLWIFFESAGMKFSDECFVLGTGEEYCSDTKNALIFYVNGKPSREFGDYVFQDNDQILISYGPEDEDVTSQIEAVTSFAPNH